MKTTIRIAFVFFGCVISGCSQRNVIIEGQAFVALENRDTVKLSSLEVLIVDASLVGERLLAASNVVFHTKPKALARLDELKAGAESALAKRAALQKNHDEAHARITSLYALRNELLRYYSDPSQPSSVRKKSEEQLLNVAQALDNKLKERARLRTELETVETKITETIKERDAAIKTVGELTAEHAIFGPKWTEVAARSVTDPEGKFLIEIRPGAYYAVASGSRKSLLGGEEFKWLLPITGKTNRLLLGSHNLFRFDQASDTTNGPVKY